MYGTFHFEQDLFSKRCHESDVTGASPEFKGVPVVLSVNNYWRNNDIVETAVDSLGKLQERTRR